MNSASKKCFWGGLLLILVTMAVLIGGGFWLLRTTAGARWLLAAASRHLELSIQAERVEGTLSDHLLLEGLRIAWDTGGLRIGELELLWTPAVLMDKRLLVERLTLNRLTLELIETETGEANSVETAAPESPPPALPRWLSAVIGELEVREFSVISAEEELFGFSRLTASLKLEEQVIQAADFSWNSPYVDLAGEFRAVLPDLDHLRLKMQAAVGLPNELVDHELLASLQIPAAAAGELEAEARFWSGFDYRGPVRLRNQDGRALLAAQAIGTLDDLRLDSLSGRWLGGELAGNLLLDWREDFWMGGELQGRRLDPVALAGDWPGTINLDFSGRLEVPAEDPLRISGKGLLHPSTLRERSLSGRFDGSWSETDLQLNRLELVGEGGQLSARGRLAERLDYRLELQDLGAWLPASAGRLKADGWLLWDGHYLAGTLQGEGTDLRWQDLNIARLSLQGRHQALGAPLELELNASDLSHRNLAAERAVVSLSGNLEQHRGALEVFSQTAALQAELSGSRDADGWRGRLESLAGRDEDLGTWRLEEPVAVVVTEQQWSLSQLVLRSELESKVRLRGDYTAASNQGRLEGRWQEVNLSRLQPWLPEIRINGKSSGSFEMGLEEERLVALTGHLEGHGQLQKEAWNLSLSRIELDLNWDGAGLRTRGSIEAGQGGALQLEVVSDRPADWDLPGNGELSLMLRDFDLQLLAPWLPDALALQGRVAAHAQGRWTPELNFTLAGDAEAHHSLLEWEDGDAKFRSELRQAGLTWDWAEEGLSGALKLVLADFGQLEGDWSLPLPARWPVALRSQAQIQGRLYGHLQEIGLLTALYPALLQESHGQLEIDLAAGGTWQLPDFTGKLSLTEAGGFLPATGIRLENLSLHAKLNGQQLEIDSFQAESGPGRLDGSGVLDLQGWRLNAYQAEITGERFQIYNYPELQILSEPELQIEGTPQRLSVRGRVLLPELLVSGTRKAPEVLSSPDTVVIVADAETVQELPMELDVEVDVVLGEEARVRTAGLDARLAGEVQARVNPYGQVTASGEIRVAEGRFAAYGTELEIHRGILRFRGGPAENPSLDIKAVREIVRVAAGVRITGTAEDPVINLYSRPTMPERDILGYIFMGRPIQEETDLLALGAGTLIPTGAGTLKGLGISEIDMQGLFSGEGGVSLRHRLADRWEIESTLGIQSGLDLFYVIEFR